MASRIDGAGYSCVVCRRANAPAGTVVTHDVPAFALIVAVLGSIFAGIGLFMHNMSLSHGAWGRTPMGIGISIGAVAGFLGLMIGMTVNGPTARRMALANAPGATPLSDAERAALARRLRIGTLSTTTLLVISVVTMATARYY